MEPEAWESLARDEVQGSQEQNILARRFRAHQHTRAHRHTHDHSHQHGHAHAHRKVGYILTDQALKAALLFHIRWRLGVPQPHLLKKRISSRKIDP